MSQESSMARRVRFLFNGQDVPGLVRFGEVALENHTIDVPTFNRIFKIQSGIIIMPEVSCEFETRRNTNTRKFLRDWYLNKEVKDITIIGVDATNTEFDRVLWSAVECKRFSEPEVDFSSPTYARIAVVFLPYDIIPVD